jgi:1,2-diacylglycerol 3-beta-galactosyltransferase
MTQIPERPHVVVYFTDAGGGHRSAAEAVVEALHSLYGDQVTSEMVDFFRSYGPRTLRLAPELYPQLVKTGLWRTGYRATDGRSRARVITASLWPYLQQIARQLASNHPANLVVSTHPFVNSLLIKAMGRNHPPFFTIVTDFASIHALWFDKRADRIFLPAEAARESALKSGMDPERLDVVGFPVLARFCGQEGDQASVRRKLGWPVDKPIALVVGGGEGMGPVAKIAQAIDESGLDLVQVIVAGRNRRLKAKLEAVTWENPTFIHGFTHEMPDFLRAADVLLTKAGGATVAEALNSHVPMIIYSRVAGQEDGNVAFVEQVGAGVYAPTTQLVIRALTRWLSRPQEREQVAEHASRAARPDAAKSIALAIGKALHLKVPHPASTH